MSMKSLLQALCLALFLIGDAMVQSGAADTLTIPSGQTGSLVPEVIRNGSGSIRFGLSLGINDPDGSIEINDFASDGTVLATTTIIFSGGFGASSYQYAYDTSYLSVNGLVDIESLFPGLDLVGELGGYPAAAEPWVSEHTELNSGKIIWSYSDGTVITLDPTAGEAEVQTPNFQGVAQAPLPLLQLQNNNLHIANLTPGAIEAFSVVPEPATLALVWMAMLLLSISKGRRL